MNATISIRAVAAVLAVASAMLLAAPAQAQQNQCRTSPVGASTSYCASEAFVTQSLGTPSVLLVTVDMSGDIAIAAGSFVQIPLKTVVYDTQSAFNTSSFKFTPAVAGKYLVGASVYITGTAATGFPAIVKIRKNGAAAGDGVFFGGAFNFTAVNVSQAISSAQGPIDMNGTTDYIDFAVLTNLTGAVIPNSTASATGETFAWAHLVK